MLKEEKWVSDREKSLTKIMWSRIMMVLSIVWLFGFFLILPYLAFLGQYFENYTIYAFILFWIVPFIFLSWVSSSLNVNFSASDRIAYHLYSVTRKLENLDELTKNTAEKDIQKHLKALDDKLRNNALVEDLFTENILSTLKDLLDSLERLNNYMKGKKKSKEYNTQVARYLRLIADNIRTDSTKITPTLLKHISQLKQELENIEPLKITTPIHKKIYEGVISNWNGLPNGLKITILSLLIGTSVWFIPEKIGLLINQNTKAIVMAPFIAIVINYYLGKQK